MKGNSCQIYSGCLPESISINADEFQQAYKSMVLREGNVQTLKHVAISFSLQTTKGLPDHGKRRQPIFKPATWLENCCG